MENKEIEITTPLFNFMLVDFQDKEEMQAAL
jgi:hypothetical protein